jgi:hypothetical protein
MVGGVEKLFFIKIKLTYGFPPGGIAIGGLRAG